MSYSDDKDLIIKNKRPKLKFSPKKTKKKKLLSLPCII